MSSVKSESSSSEFGKLLFSLGTDSTSEVELEEVNLQRLGKKFKFQPKRSPTLSAK